MMKTYLTEKQLNKIILEETKKVVEMIDSEEFEKLKERPIDMSQFKMPVYYKGLAPYFKSTLTKYLKKIHCFNTYGDRITDLLSKRSLNYSVDSSYEPPSAESKEYDVQASINNMVFQARYCDAEKKTVRLYDPVDGDYEDYHGEYEVDSKGQILEDVAFQKAKVVIGQLIGMDQEATGTC